MPGRGQGKFLPRGGLVRHDIPNEEPEGDDERWWCPGHDTTLAKRRGRGTAFAPPSPDDYCVN